jgi:hypothetical protein
VVWWGMKKERNDEKAASEIINVIFIGLESRLCLSLHSNPIPFAEFPLKLAPRGGVDDTRQNVDLFWGMEWKWEMDNCCRTSI